MRSTIEYILWLYREFHATVQASQALASTTDTVSSHSMTEANILIVEDELAIADMLQVSLSRAGHQTVAVETTADARKALAEQHFELALIDWMLPGGSGLELVRTIRADERLREMAVIMVTARASENNIANGLDAGADDYITKPFSPRELQSRIRALLRRTIKPAGEQSLTNGKLTLNSHSHRVSVNDQAVELNHTEFKLLRYLMQNPDRVYSRSQLLDGVWGPGTYVEERTVDVHVLRLRKALRAVGLDDVIETVRGAGYRLPKR